MKHDTPGQAKPREDGRGWKAHVSSLQFRMTASYIVTTLAALLILEGLNVALLAIVSSAILPEQSTEVLMPLVREEAHVYALEAQTQALDSSLNPQTTFRPNQPGTLAPPQAGSAFTIPYTTATQSEVSPTPVALVITPDGRVLASSAPGHVLEGSSATAGVMLPPGSAALITTALEGHAGSATTGASGAPAGMVLAATEPIWSRAGTPIGAVYVQMPALPLHTALFERLYPWSFLGSIFTLGTIMLVLPLVGGIFGTLATHRLVRRIQTLVAATRAVALGNYAGRVLEGRGDELGQLERHFNRMAEELDERLRQRQALAEQNARLAERSRISRELHDAISQDLFSLRLLAHGLQTVTAQDPDVRGHLATVQQTTARMTRALRALLLEMRPPELEHPGLAGALEELAALYRTRLGIAVTTSIAPVALSEEAEHALLRIAQEALANAARHAEATAPSLDLTLCDGGVQLTVRDDGQGFTTQDAHAGLGLRLMRERVQERGGKLTVESAPGQGTSLTVWLPQEVTA
jgi:signal transduction histidine kinase